MRQKGLRRHLYSFCPLPVEKTVHRGEVAIVVVGGGKVVANVALFSNWIIVGEQ